MAQGADELISTILDAAEGLVAYVDASIRFVVMNRNYERWFRRPRAEMMGQSVEHALGPETYPRIRPRIEAALRGELVEFEEYVCYPDGPKWARARYVPDVDPTGRVRGFVVYVTDITERRAAATASRVQAERLRILSELSGQLLAVGAAEDAAAKAFQRVAAHIGADMFFHFAVEQPGESLALASFGGLSDGLARSLATLKFGEAACGRVAERMEPLVLEGVQAETTAATTLIRPLGVRAYACYPLAHEGRLQGTFSVASLSRDRFAPDELEFVALVAQTVSVGQARAQAAADLRQAHDELDREVARRTARLEEAVRELEGFSYSITHDMRAPLRAMQNFSAILLEEAGRNLEPAHRDYLRRIVASGHRLDRLIRDTLAYSKIVRAELVLEPVDPSALLRSIVESYPDLQPHQARIDIAPDMTPVLANEAALTQCLANFLTNSVKFVPAGQQPQVRLWTTAEDGRVRIYCEDHGIGVPPEHRERIFALFQRLDHSYEGTGMGLSIARKAAERMGGSVGFTSTPGAGSRFWVELQRAP